MKVQITLHHSEPPSPIIRVDLPRVPVAGEVIWHDDMAYVVAKVTFYTSGSMPSVIANQQSITGLIRVQDDSIWLTDRERTQVRNALCNVRGSNEREALDAAIELAQILEPKMGL